MKDRIVEILMYLMSEMQGNKQLSDVDVSMLREQGYTPSEISAAFSWLYENMQADRAGAIRAGKPMEGSRRMFHDAEKSMFSTESQGFLILLSELGILDNADFESVIERAMMTGFEPLSPNEVREIVATVLFSKPRPEGGPGPSLLNNPDSIH